MFENELKICPRCGKKLLLSNKDNFAYFCPACQEDFYSFECMGEVICTNELMSKMKQTNL
jgi:RNA polymerase subunit RPABC4/transcription elongation factor Spt4